MPSRDLRHASARGDLPPSAPILPPLRSLITRHVPAAPPSGSFEEVALARARASARLSSRYHDQPGPWATINGDGSDVWDHWEEHGTEELPTESHYSPRFEATQSGRPMPRAYVDFTRPASPTLPDLFPSLTPQQHEQPEENRRVKRRKLDSDRLSSDFRGFQYGKYGQVQPGTLTMELVSCDGGIYLDDTTHHAAGKYAAENILKNDNTVYCTTGPRCNIVLRHQGATVFTLKELVIKAPRSNFTSP